MKPAKIAILVGGVSLVGLAVFGESTTTRKESSGTVSTTIVEKRHWLGAYRYQDVKSYDSSTKSVDSMFGYLDSDGKRHGFWNVVDFDMVGNSPDRWYWHGLQVSESEFKNLKSNQ